eukprot:COSAG02_NODE_6907_length_3295_cov_55.638611_3_plen_104_part_00
MQQLYLSDSESHLTATHPTSPWLCKAKPLHLRPLSNVDRHNCACEWSAWAPATLAAWSGHAAPHYRCSQPLTCHDYICDTCVGHLSLTCLYVMTWQGLGLVAS